MKILLVVSTLSFGGAERAAANLSRYLGQRHSLTILSFHGYVTYPYLGELVEVGLPYKTNANFASKAARLVKKYSVLHQVLKSESPDVVLSFTEGPNIIALLNKLTGHPSCYLTNTQSLPSRKYHGIYRMIYTLLLRILYCRADGVIGLSEGVKNELVEQYGVPPGIAHVVYNSVDCTEIQVSSEEIISDAAFTDNIPVVLSVGRLIPLKNHALLLRAFARLRQKISAHLVIIGTGPLETLLKGMAQNLEVQSDVFFLGWQANPFKYMRRASVFVLSSQYEGFGNVLVEAMACGCPVIATDCPFGPREILQQGNDGLLVPLDDVTSLADAIFQVLVDSDLRNRLVQNGAKRVDAFELSVVGGRYEQVILQALHRISG